MEFLDPALDRYVVTHTETEPEHLRQLNRETTAEVPMPRMIAGHYQGRVLSMLSHLIQPRYVLEVGTYTGYSAICWTEGLQAGGMVHTIDSNLALEPIIRKHIAASGAEDRITLHLGDARDIIPTLDQPFDLVYLDADKENYLHYYETVFEQVRPGGFILADNVLWSGKVLENATEQDKDTSALVAYSEHIQRDPRVQNVLLPIRDGIMVARKLG